MEHELSSEILLVSPLPGEQAELRRRHSTRRESDHWFGRIRGREVRGIVTGDGGAKARAGILAALERAQPRVVIVAGIAGGLTPGLRAGDLVVGREVRDRAGRYHRTAEAYRAAAENAGARPATIVTVERVADTRRKKAELVSELGWVDAAVVDLESAIYCEAAEGRGIDVVVVRVVSDAHDEELPSVITEVAEADGSVKPWKVATRALFAPASWPGLVVLGGRLARASKTLADAVPALADALD